MNLYVNGLYVNKDLKRIALVPMREILILCKESIYISRELAYNIPYRDNPY